MILAIVIGVAIGIGCFVPLVFGMNKARVATATSSLGQAGALLLGVLVSFVMLGASFVVCALLARASVLPFVLGEVGGLCVSAIAFGVSKNLRR